MGPFMGSGHIVPPVSGLFTGETDVFVNIEILKPQLMGHAMGVLRCAALYAVHGNGKMSDPEHTIDRVHPDKGVRTPGTDLVRQNAPCITGHIQPGRMGRNTLRIIAFPGPELACPLDIAVRRVLSDIDIGTPQADLSREGP